MATTAGSYWPGDPVTVVQRCCRRSAGLLACGLLALQAFPAAAAEQDIQLWPSVTVNLSINERWGVHLQARVRLDDDVSRVKDYLLRPFVSWRPLDSLTLDLGYDYLHSLQSRTEHRIWQAAEHHLEWRDFTIKNRVRFDQRFVEDVGVVGRFRYRLRGTHPIAGSPWYGVLSDEVLTNLNDQGSGPVSGFEQNRLRFAVGVRFLERLRLETGYEWQYVDRRSGPSHFHVFVIEFSLDTSRRPGYPWSPR